MSKPSKSGKKKKQKRTKNKALHNEARPKQEAKAINSNAEPSGKQTSSLNTSEPKSPPQANKSLFAFLSAILLFIVSAFNFGGRIYEWMVGSKFEFGLNNCKYGIADSNGRPYFFIRGDIYNSGFSPLRILDFKLELKYNDKWVPFSIKYPPENLSIINLEDSTIDDINRNKLNFLQSISQVDPKKSENGWIYGILPPKEVPGNYVLFGEEFEIRITCITIDRIKFTQVFPVYKQPQNELRPIDS
ncbi:MAG: hypothetical protein J7621_18030 [Niastella sp.]|nr:hypothetical protein [Niastella sp.]